MMGKNLKTGNKKPIPKDRMLASPQLPPLPKMYQMGIAKGVEQERERIIKLLENLADTTTNHQHKLGVLEAVACIKFNANHAALIKGENKASHTHEIEVFGAPCDCGTRHEYCGNCDWVEPCEPEGENK